MVLVTRSSSGVPLQVVSKVRHNLVWVEQLAEINHVCKIILGQKQCNAN
jgi:hypothetical protein